MCRLDASTEELPERRLIEAVLIAAYAAALFVLRISFMICYLGIDFLYEVLSIKSVDALLDMKDLLLFVLV